MKNKIIKLIALSLIAMSQFSCTSPDNTDEKNSSENVALICRSEITNHYSIAGPAIGYTCCTSIDLPTEVKAVFAGKDVVEDQRQAKLSGSSMSSSASTCVRTDSLSAIEKAKLTIGVCNSFVVHEHTRCSCNTNCNNCSVFVCNNCPGIPAGELPEVKPQDSLRSNNELLGTTTRECSSLPPEIPQ